MNATVVSVKGAEVPNTSQWATSSAVSTFQKAILTAEKAIQTAQNNDQLDSALNVLTAAQTKFESARKDGLCVPATGLTLDQPEARVGTKCKLTLHAVLAPDSSNEGVVWSSSDPTIASVDAKGVVTGKLTGGSCTITATTASGSFSDTCAVTVVQPVTALKASATRLGIALEQSALVTVTVTDKTGLAEHNLEADYDETLLSVEKIDDLTFRITAGETLTKSTKVVLTDSVSGKKVTLTVTVGLPADTVTTTLKSTELPVILGKTATLKATAVIWDDELEKASKVKPVNSAVVWESSDEFVATVDAKGKVTSVSVGTCTITATAVSGTEDCEPLTFTVTVYPVLKSVALYDNDVKLTKITVPQMGTFDMSEYLTAVWGDEGDYLDSEFCTVTYAAAKNSYGVSVEEETGVISVEADATVGKTVKITATIISGTQKKTVSLSVVTSAAMIAV
jgi:uncharacterized protein YjdB